MDFAVAAGDVIAGKYRIDRVIGTGGMGVVFAATHVDLDERVALKFLLPEAAADPVTVARFLREGRAAAKIRSEHVARVFDVGRLDSGATYLVMEHLEGRNLRALLDERGRLAIDRAVDFVLMACEALAEAHAAGIVHRDLKPSNLFLTHRADGSPCVKVLDFGISKVDADELTGSREAPGKRSANADPDMIMTKTSALLGSPRYMSPEQMACSRDVDARTDVWALGAILYELLTNERPYEAVSLEELCARIAASPPTPLLRYLPDAPDGLERAIAKCLANDRDRRHANVAELATAIAPWASDRGRLSVERIVRVQGAGARTRDATHDVAADSEAVTRASIDSPPPEGSLDRGDATMAATSVATAAAPARRKLAGVIGVAFAIAAAGAMGFAVARTSREPARGTAPAADAYPTTRIVDAPAPPPSVEPAPVEPPSVEPASTSPAPAAESARPAKSADAPPPRRNAHAPKRTAPPSDAPPKKAQPFDSRQWD